MEHLSDVQLLGLVAEGDAHALRELVERHSAWLLLRLRRRTSDEDLAAEALHDTFVAVWRNPRAFRGDGDVGAWLWGIAIRQLADPAAQARPAHAGHEPGDLGSVTHGAQRRGRAALAVEHGTVGAALRTLSPELRQVLQATVIDGLSTREAAHLLGIPQGTVKSRARIAKSRLREQLISVEGWS